MESPPLGRLWIVDGWWGGNGGGSTSRSCAQFLDQVRLGDFPNSYNEKGIVMLNDVEQYFPNLAPLLRKTSCSDTFRNAILDFGTQIIQGFFNPTKGNP